MEGIGAGSGIGWLSPAEFDSVAPSGMFPETAFPDDADRGGDNPAEPTAFALPVAAQAAATLPGNTDPSAPDGDPATPLPLYPELVLKPDPGKQLAVGAGLNPGVNSSVAPKGIPEGDTGDAGDMPNGDVIPSPERLLPKTCAAALPTIASCRTTIVTRNMR